MLFVIIGYLKMIGGMPRQKRGISADLLQVEVLSGEYNSLSYLNERLIITSPEQGVQGIDKMAMLINNYS